MPAETVPNPVPARLPGEYMAALRRYTIANAEKTG